MDSTSSVQHRQIVVSQAAKTLLENDVTEQLASTDIVDVEAYVDKLYEEYYEFQNEEDVYTKLRYYSFTKLKRRWVRAAVRNYLENKGPTEGATGTPQDVSRVLGDCREGRIPTKVLVRKHRLAHAGPYT